MADFRFIDLFSGIGAFHTALTNIGGECVMAADINPESIDTYRDNYGMDSKCDISKVDEKDIPEHDVLAGGFPCQPFSCAGHQLGFEDTRGTLFFHIARILRYHKTPFIILENVKALVGHDGGKTWEVIMATLKELGYVTTKDPLILSPDWYGIPQNRERVFIAGVHRGYLNEHPEIPTEEIDGVRYLKIDHPTKETAPVTSCYDILDKTMSAKEYNKYYVGAYIDRVLSAWNEFVEHFGSDNIHGMTLADEFGSTYDYLGDRGTKDWKHNPVTKSRTLYASNKEWIDGWMSRWDVRNFKLRDKHFEWGAEGCENVWDTVIQLRQSGVRCKKPTTYQALVAMVQVPIVGREKRYLTPRECARLQSFPESFRLHPDDHTAYRQLGNSANVDVIRSIVSQYVKF